MTYKVRKFREEIRISRGLRSIIFHLLFLPFAGLPSSFRFRFRTDWHDLFLAFSSEPLNSRFIRVVIGVRVFSSLKASNYVQFFGCQLLFRLSESIKAGSPTLEFECYTNNI